jgi:hypothetical protein
MGIADERRFNSMQPEFRKNPQLFKELRKVRHTEPNIY